MNENLVNKVRGSGFWNDKSGNLGKSVDFFGSKVTAIATQITIPTRSSRSFNVKLLSLVSKVQLKEDCIGHKLHGSASDCYFPMWSWTRDENC